MCMGMMKVLNLIIMISNTNNYDGDAILVEICLRLVQSDDATGP